MKTTYLTAFGLLACSVLLGCGHHHAHVVYVTNSPGGASLQSQLNSSLKGASIIVESTSKGYLVLRGTVASKQQKKEATQIAQKLAPGARISNKLIVPR